MLVQVVLVAHEVEAAVEVAAAVTATKAAASGGSEIFLESY